MNKTLADLIFPDIKLNISDYEKMYPVRDLDKNSIVTRYAPSPTGFIHIGALLACFIEGAYAKQTNGVFYLRIEDTDTKRTIDDGINEIINGLKEYGVTFDEAPINENEDNGNYGPYIQSKRGDIYKTFVKYLIEEGKAYPCFCTPEELNEMREYQEKRKDRIGYYGKFATCRELKIEDTIKKIESGESYIIRLKSPGKFENKIVCNDLIRGNIEMPENDIDIPILKSDGLPSYHFAHLVDDYLMRTTHVIRADEWLSSMPLHIQLFDVFGFTRPKYAHISPLAKNDNGSIRKLSKRKDPEAAMSYYHSLGVPVEAVRLYLATISSSSFEMWYNENPNKEISDFKLEFNKMNKAPALFDIEKVNSISRTYISRLKSVELYNQALNYYREYDIEFLDLLEKYKDYSVMMLNIEREVPKPRKDIAYYSDIKKEFSYMYDELFFDNSEYLFQAVNDHDEIKTILTAYINDYYDINDDKDTWFNKMKELCYKLGYATDMKTYKESPESYKGSVADLSMVVRVALTKRTMTPDLYEIMKLLGIDRIKKRFEVF